MGRRRRDGRRRAAKVEAQRRRRTRPTHTRATPTVGSDAGELGPVLPVSVDDETSDDRQTLVQTLWRVREWARLAVADTLELEESLAGRLLAAKVDANDDRGGGDRPTRRLLVIPLSAWLFAARRARPDGLLGEEAVAWIAEHLGPSGDEVRRAAELVLGAPSTDTAFDDLGDEMGAEFVAILVWLVAAVVALLGDGDVNWVDVEDFGSESAAARVRRAQEDLAQLQ